jgi:hypothetical protein
LPFSARFALALMSTVWIVPFLMFFDVTTMVAAVAVVLATMADTTAAISALLMCPPFRGLLPRPQTLGIMWDLFP